MNWQPIETYEVQPFNQEKWFVPGKTVLLAGGSSRAFTGAYGYTKLGKGRWYDEHGRVCRPTHWQPLPEPPQ